MSLYRVRRVLNGVTQVVNMYLIDISANTKTQSQLTPSWYYNNTLAQCVSQYNSGAGVIMDFNPAVMCFAQSNYENATGYANLATEGVLNVVKATANIVGTKFIFNNNNYIEIVSVNERSTVTNVSLAYKLENGTVAFNVSFDVETDIAPAPYNTSNVYLAPIPWYNGNSQNPNLLKWVMGGLKSGLKSLYAIDPNGRVSLELAKQFFTGLKPIDPGNPYDPGGTSEETTQPPGNFSDDSDSVTEDTMPTISAIGTGMATIFSPSVSQLKSLSDVFWGANWWQALQNTIEGIDKMFVSLGIVPFEVTKGSTVEVEWLGLSITEVMLTLAAQQYYEFNMGTIDLSNDSRIFTSGSALDYSPFSKIGIYLPFIGYEELDIDEVRGATVNLIYRIDILSGTCVALIKVSGKTIYQFTGNCITQIPITSQNFENMFTNAVNVGIALGTTKAGAAAASAGAEASLERAASSEVGLAQHEAIGAVKAAKVASANSSLASATANTMMGMKPTFNKTGAVSASASLLAVKQPFLFLTTPRQCLPEHYQRYCGFPSNITGKLGSFSGYTVVEDIRLNGLVATSAEVGEIYDLLKSGVIV